MAELFGTGTWQMSGPWSDATAVTPHDSQAQPGLPSRGLYIGVSGDVSVITQGGTTITFKAVPVGFFPVLVSRVRATGTSATDIIAGQ